MDPTILSGVHKIGASRSSFCSTRHRRALDAPATSSVPAAPLVGAALVNAEALSAPRAAGGQFDEECRSGRRKPALQFGDDGLDAGLVNRAAASRELRYGARLS